MEKRKKRKNIRTKLNILHQTFLFPQPARARPFIYKIFTIHYIYIYIYIIIIIIILIIIKIIIVTI